MIRMIPMPVMWMNAKQVGGFVRLLISKEVYLLCVGIDVLVAIAIILGIGFVMGWFASIAVLWNR